MAIPHDTKSVLRRMLATLAYRAAKVLRDAPSGFGDFASGPSTRTPVQIVAHMGDLMDWGVRMIREGKASWTARGSDDWDHEVTRFFAAVHELDRAMAEHEPDSYRVDGVIQGPLADALSHTGQLAMLRGSFGVPVKPESYARAEITVGRVGMDQPTPRFEFDGDASRPPAS